MNMNKLSKILLSILAGIEAVFYIFSPILLVALWVNIFGLYDFGSSLVYMIGLFATVFRAIKVGWMR